jgi:hypothetical protein
MNQKTELKILSGLSKAIKNVESKATTYKWTAVMLFTVGFICVAQIFKGAEGNEAIIGFVAGISFGVGFFLSQMPMQVKIIAEHLSEKSIENRINEIER